MKKYVLGTVAVALIVAVVAVIGVRSLLGKGEEPEFSTAQDSAQQAGQDSAGAAGQQPVADRPVCPAGPIAGVDLPCLGAKSYAEAREVQIVNIWAWWCEPCRAELPYFQQIARKHSAWNVVGVHADADAAKGAAFLEDIGVDLPSYQDDDNSFAGELGLPGVIPITLVVVDGQVKGTFVKPFTSSEELDSAIQDVIG
ncbi:TlpA disulfide reductase family protein [Corynebacterium sp.]|uniref:TlpA family protein disulfide reductase n=1 Tax=Corynebacterium sp. TaxID=1720 RepID=UPI0026DD9746|nr:TlpA disulfide reductase family protein [Corynebacterium sp.]MDO5031855.1 TlpA disulfide reductase family protein [Corynebacterium sp.]